MKILTSRLNVELKDKRILDVGCGYGHLLFAIKEKYGSKVSGVEPSKKIAEIGHEYFGIEIEANILENYKPEEKFDLIICNHTIEHADNPTEFLLKMRELLNDNGFLYIEVPNILKPTGNFNLNTFLYNEHLQTFSASNLEKLLNRCGLQVVQYNDSEFLMFYLRKANGQKILVEEIKAHEVLSFLENYKLNYKWHDSLEVYINKFIYLLKVIRYKLLL